MSASAPATATGYRLIEKPARIYAIDDNDIEICGARQPYGHENWVVYATPRVANRLHQVIAVTRSDAIAHVEMIADLYVRAT